MILGQVSLPASVLVPAVVALIVALGGWLLQRRDQKLRWAEFRAKYDSPETRILDYVDRIGKPRDPDALNQGASESTACSGTPYVVGPYIKSPENFYGRQNLLDQFFERCLLGPQVACVRVVGARRAGKTSFLHHVQHPDVRECYLGQHFHDTVMVYIDLLAVSTPPEFYSNLLSATDLAFEQLGRRIPVLTVSGKAQHVNSLYARLCGQGWRFLILLDEFEKLVETSTFDQAFFEWLRALASLPDVGIVTSSYRNPFMIDPSPQQKTSPLANIFHGQFYLDAFSVDEARMLVREPAASVGKAFSPADVDYVVDMAGRLPFSLQAGSWALYQAHGEGRTGPDARECAHVAFRELMAEHFQRYWNHFTTEERKALVTLARSPQPAAPDTQEVFTELANYGFIERIDGVYCILGSAFAEWVTCQ